MIWLKQKLSKFALPFIFIMGLGLLTYPTISDYWNSFHQSEAIMSYTKSVSKMSTEDYKRILASAKQYNATHGMDWNFSDEDKAAYEKELNFNNDGSMGYIDIPKINVKLTIFHGTDESVLQTSIGHLEGTSLPVGEKEHIAFYQGIVVCHRLSCSPIWISYVKGIPLLFMFSTKL